MEIQNPMTHVSVLCGDSKNNLHINSWPGKTRSSSKEKETKKEDENTVAEDGCFIQE